MTDTDHDKDRITALSSLLLHTPGPAIGRRPTTDELWDWIHGDTTEQRAVEIKTHIATDGNVYEEWRELRLALIETDDPLVSTIANAADTPSRVHRQRTQISNTLTDLKSRIANTIKSWDYRVPPVLVTGTVAFLAIGIALFNNQLTAEKDFWRNWQQPKSQLSQALTPATQNAYRAILSGVRDEMISHSYQAVDPQGNALPKTAANCLASADCQQQFEILVDLGKLMVSGHLACHTESAKITVNHAQLLEIKNTIETWPPVSALDYPIEQWVDSENIEIRCAAVENLITRTLQGI